MLKNNYKNIFKDIMSKKINIFVGNVGSAYIDKETASKNITIAQQNIIDTQSIIDKATALEEKIKTALTIAENAKTKASDTKSILEDRIIQYSNIPTKYNKLIEIKNNLIINDTDGIWSNGGNVETALANINKLNNLQTIVGNIKDDAQLLKEDNRKLLLNRQEELSNSTIEFNNYITNTTNNVDYSDVTESELNGKIDEVTNNVNEANETSNAINETSDEVTNQINDVITSDEEEIIVLNNSYWYVGQYMPFGDSFTVNESDVTKNEVNTWHILTFRKLSGSNTSALITGIDSNSDLTTWYVIVPKDLDLTPVNSDLQTYDTNWTARRQVTVNNEPAILYEVNNKVSTLTPGSVKRLNVIMLTDVDITPITALGYWYVGPDEPVEPYFDNVVAGLVNDDSTSVGWRRIKNPFNSYIKPNYLNTDITLEVENNDPHDFYIVIPDVFKFDDGTEDQLDDEPYKTIVINNINYTVYKLTGIEYIPNIYYEGNSSEEPVVLDGVGYWYVGNEYVTSPYLDHIASNLVNNDSLSSGWRKITNSFNSYSKPNYLHKDKIIDLRYDENDFNYHDYYLIIPVGFKFEDGGGELTLPSYNQININDITYNVYKLLGSEFTFNIYYEGNNESTGPIEPTSSIYWYIGKTQPTNETVIANNIVTSNESVFDENDQLLDLGHGWRIIPEGTYDAVNPVWQPTNGEGICINTTFDDEDYYLALPQNYDVHPSTGGFPHTELGTIELNGVTYKVWQANGKVFAFAIY